MLSHSSSFAGVISLDTFHQGIKQLPSNPNYSELSEWRIDYCTTTKVFTEDLKTFIIGCANPSSASSMDKFTTTTTTNNEDCIDNELIQCIMIMGASTPTIYNLEITNGHLDDDAGELSFKWKDVKHLACIREFLFIATVDNRVFGIDIKMNYFGHSDKNFHFGKKNYPKIGKLMITCETLGRRIESAFFQVDDLRDLKIECMAANELTLFVILSNGKLYSLGHNNDGGAARGQKNVHGVDFGECEVKLKRNSKKPKFIKVIGSGRKVAALTDSGSIYLCGSRVLSLMGLDPYHNLYMFKEFEFKSEKYHFTDVEICDEGITAMTRDDCGLHIRRFSKTLYGKVKQRDENDEEQDEQDDNEDDDEEEDEDNEDEEEDEDNEEEDNEEEDNEEESEEEDGTRQQNETEIKEKSGELVPKRRLIKCLNHSNCGILIYNDHSVEIRRLGEVYAFKFSLPSSYPNLNGPIYELNCSWLDEPMNFNAFFYWKYNKENYLNACRHFKRIKSYSNNQLLTDVIIKCLTD